MECRCCNKNLEPKNGTEICDQCFQRGIIWAARRSYAEEQQDEWRRHVMNRLQTPVDDFKDEKAV